MKKVLYWMLAAVIFGMLPVGISAETANEEDEIIGETEEITAENTAIITVEREMVYEGENFTADILLANTAAAVSLAFSDFSFAPDYVEFIGAEWLLADAVITDVDVANGAAAIAYAEAVDMNGAVLRLHLKALEVSESTSCEIGCSLAVLEADGVRTELAVTAGTVEIIDYIRGDTNGDDVVTSADAVYLLRYTMLPESYPLNGGDFDYNNDGSVDAEDAVRLLYHAMLPEKYPLETEGDTEVVSGTGFVISPYINDDSVYFKTEGAGEVWYYFSKDGSAVASSEFEENYDDVSRSYLYGQVDVAGTNLTCFTIDEDVDFGDYPYLVIAFLSDENNVDERKFNYPVVLGVSDTTVNGTDGSNTEDDSATTSKTGLSVSSVDVRNHIITITANYSGEVTVSLYVDGKSNAVIGSFDVSAGDTVEFDYSKQSAAIELLVGNGSEVEIVFQLVNETETYKSVKVPVFE